MEAHAARVLFQYVEKKDPSSRMKTISTSLNSSFAYPPSDGVYLLGAQAIQHYICLLIFVMRIIFLITLLWGVSMSPALAESSLSSRPARHAATDTSILSTLGKTLDFVVKSAGNTIEWLNPLAFKYALTLDLPVEELSNEKLLRFMEEWMGVRYRMGGDSKAGIDCSALTRRLLNEVYSLTVGRIVPDQLKAGIEIPREALQMGDLLFFKISNRRPGPTHVGIYLGNNRFIHASIKNGVIIESLENTYYQANFKAAIRLPKL